MFIELPPLIEVVVVQLKNITVAKQLLEKESKNIKLTNHLSVIIICIISIFAGFFIGRITSSSSEISSLEKSNIENEATLKAKQTELSKLKEKLQKKVDSIEDLERTISELNTQLEQSYSWEESYYFEETVDSYTE